MVAVRNILDDKNTPEDISLDQLLDSAKVPHDTYVRGLGICTKGNSIVYHRERSDAWINPYNADVMRVWRANMDLQYILDPYACVMYIASYMLKSEKAMSELLRQVSRECASEDIKTQLRRLGSVFMNHRELSAQAAVYRILSLPLKQLSRTVVFVSTDPKDKRTCLLKPRHELENLDENSEDIYMTSLIDRYAARPGSLDDMCLAEFAANYTCRSGEVDDDNEGPSDALPPANEDTRKCEKIKLKNRLGNMYKRKGECVIRFHCYNREKQTSEMYRAKLMLYIPWRDEAVDLLAGRADFKSHYEERADTILHNERKYSKNASLIHEAMNDFHEFGPPTHPWDQVAPGLYTHSACTYIHHNFCVHTLHSTCDLCTPSIYLRTPTYNLSNYLCTPSLHLHNYDLYTLHRPLSSTYTATSTLHPPATSIPPRTLQPLPSLHLHYHLYSFVLYIHYNLYTALLPSHSTCTTASTPPMVRISML